MQFTIAGKSNPLTAPNAVRIGENDVQKMVNDVGVMLERIHEDIRRGGVYTLNDEGGYYEMTYVTTGDVFVWGTISVHKDGSAYYEVEVMKPERRAAAFFPRKDRF